MLKVGEFQGQRLPNWRVRWDDDPADATIRWAAEHATRFLAAFVSVGTVDQAMLATMQVKHAHLRGSSLPRPEGFAEPRAVVLIPETGLDAFAAPKFDNGIGAWPTKEGSIKGIYMDLFALPSHWSLGLAGEPTVQLIGEDEAGTILEISGRRFLYSRAGLEIRLDWRCRSCTIANPADGTDAVNAGRVWLTEPPRKPASL